MKTPTSATLLLGRNCEYPIDTIHFNTRQITLKESEKVYNTVSIKNVIFNYSGFSDDEIRAFQNAFNN